jgi:tripartite-type tricarboxylate transporter receptor subunit TctC
MFHRISRLTAFRLAATLLACGAGLSAQAQSTWPTAKPITLIVPFSAGGNVDVTARLVGQKLAERLKQSVIIENVVGAGGTIGVEKAVKAAPDGYTLVLGADSPVAIAKLVNPAAVRYDGLKDLAPVGLVTTAPMVIVARPGLAANNLADVIRLAKEKPGQLSYATSGVGTVLHLTMELIKEQSKTYMVHVPYRGGAQIVTDVIGNQVDLAMVVSVTATPHIQGKKLKGIAVTEAHRLPSLPDLPAVSESAGFKGFDMVSWTGLFAPAQTPPALVERLNRELMEVLHSEEVRSKLAEGGATAGSGSATDFTRFVQKEQARYAAIVKTANIRD